MLEFRIVYLYFDFIVICFTTCLTTTFQFKYKPQK